VSPLAAYDPAMVDSRVACVEENLLAFMALLVDRPPLRGDPDTDLVSFSSPIPFPLFNAAMGASFAPADVERRTHEVLDRAVQRGMPFLWWLTPSTTSPALEATLVARGLVRQEVPGMYADLTRDLPAPAVQPGPDVRVDETEPDEMSTVIDTMVAGFGMPDLVRDALRQVMAGIETRQMSTVLARAGGAVVGTGTLFFTAESAGLYNIATLESARGRGIGYAVTAALMELARSHAHDTAVLHASALGRPVYERLGFVEVCQVPQYLWLPPAT
jgi:GNAT superfamily N-acetyltransferase